MLLYRMVTELKIRLLRWLMIICLMVLLSGCQLSEQPPVSSLKLVTSVAVDCRHHKQQLQRQYTQTDKIAVILHYLHKLKGQGTPSADPEQLRSDHCRITVQLSNGEKHIYRLQGKQYLSIDLRPWKIVNSQQASVLYHLIGKIPGDVSGQTTVPKEKTASAGSESQN